MRIKNRREFDEICGQGPRTKTQNQLAVALEEAEKLAKTRKAPTTPSRNKRTKLEHSLRLCPLPPADPADILYQRLVREWGRFYSGGDVVWELEAIPGRKLRIDAAIVSKRVALESDGWEWHGKHLQDFKDDRLKTLTLSEHGWLVIPVSREMVVDRMEATIQSIREVMAHRPTMPPPVITRLPGGWSRVLDTP